MVAFTTTDLPSSINSVEKLTVWATTVLQHLHPSLTVIEAPNQSQLAATAQPYFISISDPPVWRYVSRSSIALNSNWQRGATKIWTHAQDLSNQAIPTEFKS